jgi:hypothetical protein
VPKALPGRKGRRHVSTEPATAASLADADFGYNVDSSSSAYGDIPQRDVGVRAIWNQVRHQ